MDVAKDGRLKTIFFNQQNRGMHYQFDMTLFQCHVSSFNYFNVFIESFYPTLIM